MLCCRKRDISLEVKWHFSQKVRSCFFVQIAGSAVSLWRRCFAEANIQGLMVITYFENIVHTYVQATSGAHFLQCLPFQTAKDPCSDPGCRCCLQRPLWTAGCFCGGGRPAGKKGKWEAVVVGCNDTLCLHRATERKRDSRRCLRRPKWNILCLENETQFFFQ